MSMIRKFASWLALAAALPGAAAGEPNGVPRPSAGRIVDLGVLTSQSTDPRRVVVWLPESYERSRGRYAVLYMHDGQNLFDKATAGYGMEWQVDEVASRLMREGKMRPTIVVGIWNTSKRLREYVPSKAFTHLPRPYLDRVRGLYGGDPLSDGYLRFLARELKPMIDARFRTRRDRSNTVIMGSSMGGLISLYAINEYPRVFGAAGMLSTHWPLFLPSAKGEELSNGEFEAVSGAFEAYLRPNLADRRHHRLYFDHGTETLDAYYARYQRRVDAVVAAHGYRQGANWMVRNFPGQKHNEESWASRVHIPLMFLLPPDGARR